MNNNFRRVMSEFSIPLIAGVLAALIWVNADPLHYKAFLHTKLFWNVDFHFLVNDVFMVLFFGLAGAEIMHSLLPGGHLNPLNKAATPLLATLGGVLGPIVVFFTGNALFGSPEYAPGWAIPTATDIAISWLAARLIFGKVHPAVSFLLLLAVADDAVGVAIIALFYPDPLNPVEPVWMSLVALAMLAAWVMRTRLKVFSYWPYLLFCGTVAWCGMLLAHMHPALTLVFIVPFLPYACCRCPKADAPAPVCACVSPLIRFEEDFKAFVDFGLFFFGLANAGVELHNISSLSILVFLSLLIGKTVGVFSLAKAACLFGFSLPQGMGAKELLVMSMVAGIGLTVALFVSGVAYTDQLLQGGAKMGALFSSGAAFLAFATARLLGIKAAR